MHIFKTKHLIVKHLLIYEIVLLINYIDYHKSTWIMTYTLCIYRIKQFNSLTRQNCLKKITQSLFYHWSIAFNLHFLELLSLFSVEVVTSLHLTLMDLNLLTVHSIFKPI